ncbi:MAG TPA: YceI family protein [Mycobacteriales bacterium]|jgi:polyisoprenoid-binding protein YceI|nr:YceI family protein [Mycobacteriales bacterium]
MTSTAAETTTTATTLTGTWAIDPSHSRLGFSARHAMVATVRGGFREFDGTLHLDEADPARSSAHVTIQSASIDTSVADRDGHLRSGDFLDVETHPTLTFTSTSARAAGDDEYVLVGDLTIRGVAKPVELAVTYLGTSRDAYGNLRAGFEAETTINRKDFGLVWNVALETGGILVGDKIKIAIDISAIKQA